LWKPGQEAGGDGGGISGTTLDGADRYALEMIQEALQRLGFATVPAVREEMGLAYYVGHSIFPGVAPGYFAFYVGTMPEKVDLVEKELLREAELLRTEGFAEPNSNARRRKSSGRRKSRARTLGIWRPPRPWTSFTASVTGTLTRRMPFMSVTLEQVKAAAQKYLRAEAA